QVTITVAQINNGSSAPCGIASLSIDKTSFDCSNAGPNTVTLTATDNNGNSQTCTATVTVVDQAPPVAICRNLTIQLDATGHATITPAQIDNGSSDVCGIAGLSLDKTSFDCSNIGANTVALTVTDNNGNSQTCLATVTVVDAVAPVVSCSPVPGASADGACQAAVPNVLGGVTASASCSGPSAISLRPAA